VDDKTYEEIKYNGKLIATMLRSDCSSDHIIFFSPPDSSQQFGCLS